MPLTKEQEDIVKSIGKPMLVLAGPGTGKTEILAHGILYLLKNHLASKEEITGITFTIKAADQMRKRLIELGMNEENQPLICTLHSLAMRILRDSGGEIDLDEDFSIADGYESSLLLNDAILDVSQKVIRAHASTQIKFS